MTTTRMGWVLAVLLGAGAVGCATPEVSGRVKLVYHSNAERGTGGDQPGTHITFVNEGNDQYVGEEGEPITGDDSVKIVSNARMAELLSALDDAGFGAAARSGDLDAALEAGAREAIALDRDGRSQVVGEPVRPLDTEAKRDAMRAFVQMKQVLFLEQQNHTQFFAVGTGRDRPKWAPAPR